MSGVPMDEIEQRKAAALAAGYDNPMCAACGNMSSPSSKVCKRCIAETPAFNAAVVKFMTATKGTRQ